jgi:hypothetical protein
VRSGSTPTVTGRVERTRTRAGSLDVGRMSKKTSKAPPPKYQAWAQARRRHRLSHAHVQMAREFGMNPERRRA